MEKAAGTTSSKANFVRVNQSDPEAPLILSYLGLRKAVGIIGVALPFVLLFGRMLLQGWGIEGSISCYYYTRMGNVFVGSMCAIGMFLMSCRGYDWKDAIFGRLACVFAIGLALFPTTPCSGPAGQPEFIGKIHWSCAALLFLTLSYFCLALFTKTAPDKHPTPQKLRRNIAYRICGYAILACIALIVVVKLPGVQPMVEPLRPVFVLESAAILAFGVAWLIKGETILKDQEG